MKGPTRFWFKEVIADVMYACIILHNMIVKHEGGSVTDWADDEAGSSTATPPHVRGLRMGHNEVLARGVKWAGSAQPARAWRGPLIFRPSTTQAHVWVGLVRAWVLVCIYEPSPVRAQLASWSRPGRAGLGLGLGLVKITYFYIERKTNNSLHNFICKNYKFIKLS